MKLINRASEYIRANPMAPNYNMNYIQNSAYEKNPWGQNHGGFVDAAAMANRDISRRADPRYAYGPAAGGFGGHNGA